MPARHGYVTLSRQSVITADLARGVVRVGCTRRLLADFRDDKSGRILEEMRAWQRIFCASYPGAQWAQEARAAE